MIKAPQQKGIAILIAVIAVSAMLLIALAISDIAYKQQILTFYGRDSKLAFYAANAGIECALFHDFGGGIDGNFYFSTSTLISNDVYCAGQGWPAYINIDANVALTKFYFNIETVPESCAIVEVTKTVVNPTLIKTKIESRGHNNLCEGEPDSPTLPNDMRNLERALKMTYPPEEE